VLPVLLNLGSSLIVAIVTAALTVRLALRRFYSEKWWERKAAAYTAIIEALHHVREHADTNLVFTKHDRELPTDGAARLEQNMQKAMAELRKHRDVGSLVVSQDAVAALNRLFFKLDRATQGVTWLEHLEMKVPELDESLEEMRQIARKDLSLK
jgi:hypothetical protein